MHAGVLMPAPLNLRVRVKLNLKLLQAPLTSAKASPVEPVGPDESRSHQQEANPYTHLPWQDQPGAPGAASYGPGTTCQSEEGRRCCGRFQNLLRHQRKGCTGLVFLAGPRTHLVQRQQAGQGGRALGTIDCIPWSQPAGMEALAWMWHGCPAGERSRARLGKATAVSLIFTPRKGAPPAHTNTAFPFSSLRSPPKCPSLFGPATLRFACTSKIKNKNLIGQLL